MPRLTAAAMTQVYTMACGDPGCGQDVLRRSIGRGCPNRAASVSTNLGMRGWRLAVDLAAAAASGRISSLSLIAPWHGRSAQLALRRLGERSHAPLHTNKPGAGPANISRLAVGLIALAIALPGLAASLDGEPPDDERIYLWPGRTAPGSKGLPLQQQISERSDDAARPDRAITGVSQPYLVVYRPRKPNGIGLLVTPGGGYQRIVLDKEGAALVPDFVDSGGITLFVLRYRLPDEGHAGGADAPLADAQRALRLIRARAQDWQLDPQRIGVMGFSAGGHVAASLGTRFEEKVYKRVDRADALTARPDFMLLIYPVISMDSAISHPGSRARLLGPQPTADQERNYSAEQRVSAGTPPAFLLHAEDDEVVSSANSLRMHAALRAAGVPVEMHLYPHGGHGFGVRETTGLSVALWPQLALRWMQSATGNPLTTVPGN